jgi:hypothetical protein
MWLANHKCHHRVKGKIQHIAQVGCKSDVVPLRWSEIAEDAGQLVDTRGNLIGHLSQNDRNRVTQWTHANERFRTQRANQYSRRFVLRVHYVHVSAITCERDCMMSKTGYNIKKSKFGH